MKTLLFAALIQSVVSDDFENVCEASTCGSDSLILNNGVRMPTIGLGTAGFTQTDVVNRAVDAALENGYRMIGEQASKTSISILFVCCRYRRFV